MSFHCTLYETLGVPVDASEDLIEARFFERSQACASARPTSHVVRRYQTLLHAYNILRVPEKRAAYDASLASEEEAMANILLEHLQEHQQSASAAGSSMAPLADVSSRDSKSPHTPRRHNKRALHETDAPDDAPGDGSEPSTPSTHPSSTLRRVGSKIHVPKPPVAVSSCPFKIGEEVQKIKGSFSTYRGVVEAINADGTMRIRGVHKSWNRGFVAQFRRAPPLPPPVQQKRPATQPAPVVYKATLADFTHLLRATPGVSVAQFETCYHFVAQDALFWPMARMVSVERNERLYPDPDLDEHIVMPAARAILAPIGINCTKALHFLGAHTPFQGSFTIDEAEAKYLAALTLQSQPMSRP